MSPAMIPGNKWYYISAMLFSVLLMPDLVFDLLTQLMHGFFELLEYSLDLLIEHVFHTDRHTTQVIVFYILIAAVGLVVYELARYVPSWHRSVKIAGSRQFKLLKIEWLSMPLYAKAKFSLGLFVALYVMMLLLG